MNERENILGRIREALRVPAPYPGDGHSGAPPAAHGPTELRPWLPPVGPTAEDRLALFQKNAVALKAELCRVRTMDELGGFLLGLRDSEGWKKIGSHGAPLTDFACAKLGLPVCRTDERYETAELESCSAGITECDALIAQTGSVLITSRSAGGRALSVLPPHHVVLSRREQLLADLPEGFVLLKKKYAGNYPSFISFVTGPSRTGDIERILVLGAHGPKKLTILLLDA